MTRRFRLGHTFASATLLLAAASVAHAQRDQLPQPAYADTVHVAPATGEPETDRANVQAAFDAVQPGGTVLFSPGIYLLGAGVRLTVPDVTVLGHTDGTILRGCDPEAFVREAVFECAGFYIQTERQTVRRLTFEYFWHGIVIGPHPTTAEEAAARRASGGFYATPYPVGGHRIGGNTFRATVNGLRVLGIGTELTVVSGNDFIDTFHAIGIWGTPLHFLDNRITVANPARVPFARHPGSAVIVGAGHTDCSGHVVAGNSIEGHPDAIYVLVRRGETCRGTEIRDNTIHVRRVKIPAPCASVPTCNAPIGAPPTESDSTIVGTPISLVNNTAQSRPGMSASATEGVLENIVVEGNRVVGAEGLGVRIQNASRNRILDNTIEKIARRAPFPGNTWDSAAPLWGAANGSGIWVSPGSDENEIAGNSFEDLAAFAVFIQGSNNQVTLRTVSDTVRDLGTNSRVTHQPEAK
jgi:parallel beta-helix repeat protein